MDQSEVGPLESGIFDASEDMFAVSTQVLVHLSLNQGEIVAGPTEEGFVFWTTIEAVD